MRTIPLFRCHRPGGWRQEARQRLGQRRVGSQGRKLILPQIDELLG